MVDNVKREIERVRGYISDGRLAACDETNTKATAIEPILRELGWNMADLDEVKREYPIRGRSIDFLLFCDDAAKVIVEAKRGNQSLHRHQEQLQDYAGFALAERVEIAILTNGAEWWYYLPFRTASWEQRRVATVEFSQQDSKKIAQKLVDLLGQENVRSGSAIQNAERHQILETLPEVWNQLVRKPDNSIVNLLTERTHKLCVREPARNEVEQFLSSHSQQILITPDLSTTESAPPPHPTVSPEPKLPHTLTGTKPVAFTFGGSRYEVMSWKEMLVGICMILKESNRDRFEEILDMKGKKKPYFSRNREDLQAPRKINGTDVYAETNFNAPMTVQIARRLITHFGYDESDLSYETRTL